ncbi:hypothetical protein E3U23_11290 [Erythrobacter litoralis]|uniref:hypothetical protein n=1 Tax=Erythrobacter litoralis TaxID=39960 RepID=UPI002434BC3C|nr:hypothetical protein [Erythrobacter litoralis]MDG6079773.1 hypothetical protein [Erythrobacter litoralis]
MRQSAFVVAFAILGLGGCDTSEPASLSDLEVTWDELSDGSMFLSKKQDFTKHMAERCWPSDDDAWSCVHLYEDSETGILFAQRVERDTLPDTMMMSMAFDDGYQCSHYSSVRETIEKGADTVASNSLGYGAPAWTEDYVVQFLKDNQITGSGHFDCAAVMRAVLGSSPAALGTTNVSSDVVL